MIFGVVRGVDGGIGCVGGGIGKVRYDEGVRGRFRETTRRLSVG